MIKATEINTTGVTPEQIGACHKIFEGSTPAYMVQSESDSLVEYKVRWSKEHGFTCTCKAGKVAFSNCKAGYCKHVLWSVAAGREEKEAVAELHRLIAEQAAPVAQVVTNVDAATLKRIEAANERQAGKPASKAKPYQPKAFSLLK
jgi:hypothetical protein